MADITGDLNRIITANEPFQQILLRADLHVESVIWADDVAIPIATDEAQDLPTAIETILVAAYEIFSRRGFTLNLKKGKTSVVATFRGPGAPLMRAKYQLCPRPGMDICLGPQTEFVHFVAHYKHLGTIFSSSHTMDLEIATRIGMAKSAFAQVAAPILCNRHLPESIRVRMFRTLIESRLFFGLGAWKTPTSRQMAKIHAALIAMLRRLFRLKPEEIQRTTAADLFHRAKICSPRARLAVDRLLYAQKLWQNGPEMLQHCLHREEALTQDSWLLGLKHDLQWLCSLEPMRLAPLTELSTVQDPSHFDLTDLFDFWQAGGSDWKACVKRAWKRFVQQEAMMNDLMGMHKQFFHVLTKSGGATFDPTPHGQIDERLCTFSCHCGRQFTTAQGLATHRRRKHEEFSLEHDLVEGTVCPECLRHFWSKQRLHQHLSYIPRRSHVNSCYQALRQKGFKADLGVGSFQQLPKEVRGLGRVEAQQTAGPLQPLAVLRHQARQEILDQIDQLRRSLEINQIPDDPSDIRQRLENFLTTTTSDWFERFCQEGYDEDIAAELPDMWLAVLFQFEDGIDEWIEAEILAWGQNHLPDLIANFVDGVAERLVDEAYANMIDDFPRQQTLRQIAHCEARLRLFDEEGERFFPHRTVRRAMANVAERAVQAAKVDSLFEAQEVFFAQVSAAKWLDLPRELPLPFYQRPHEPPMFIIAHLFSGRRRTGDVHDRLHHWAAQAGIQVLVLSLDTANSTTYGDLHHTSITWHNLLRLYQEGRISATIAGAPCETWSAARHHVLVDAEGNPVPGQPRPLRDRTRLFGRAQLSFRELRQLQQGSLFFMQMAITVAWAIITGAIYLSEHPGPPGNIEAASIWLTPWIKLLRAHPAVALHVVAQWKWGCTVSKPTGLLAVRLPYFGKSMHSRQKEDASPPKEVAIGVGPNGQFKTSAHKEYPMHFCDALAGTVIDQIKFCQRHKFCRASTDMDPEVLDWLQVTEEQCSALRTNNSWLPDYQGT